MAAPLLVVRVLGHDFFFILRVYRQQAKVDGKLVQGIPGQDGQLRPWHVFPLLFRLIVHYEIDVGTKTGIIDQGTGPASGTQPRRGGANSAGTGRRPHERHAAAGRLGQRSSVLKS